MNSKDFTIWLKGFVSASNNYNLTPAGWDTLKEELSKVDDRHEGVLINPHIPFNPPYVSDNFTIGPDGAYERDPNQPSFGTPNFTYTTGSAGWRYSTTNDKTLLNEVDDDDEFELGGSE